MDSETYRYESSKLRDCPQIFFKIQFTFNTYQEKYIEHSRSALDTRNKIPKLFSLCIHKFVCNTFRCAWIPKFENFVFPLYFIQGKTFFEFRNPCTSKCVTYQFSKLCDCLQKKMQFTFSTYQEKYVEHSKSAVNTRNKIITIFSQPNSGLWPDLYYGEREL